jgi:hypothetical protein
MFVYHCMSYLSTCMSLHRQIWHHANICIHSSILVTETLENKLVEPIEIVEPKPDIGFIVELEENQGKQLSMIFFPT